MTHGTQLTKKELALLWIVLDKSGGKKAPAVYLAKTTVQQHPHLVTGRRGDHYSKADYTRMIKQFLGTGR